MLLLMCNYIYVKKSFTFFLKSSKYQLPVFREVLVYKCEAKVPTDLICFQDLN